MFFLLLLFTAFSSQPLRAESPPPQAPAIRFLLPNGAFSMRLERELNLIVEDYQRGHPEARILLLKRGEEFSSLRDLMALHLAGDPPEIAAIECSEFPAIEGKSVAITGPKLFALTQGMKPWVIRRASGSSGPASLPFLATAPVLLADQELLFRAHADTEKMPTTWKQLMDLARRLSSHGALASSGTETSSGEPHFALALPLQGSRGLWLFENLSGRPLWIRERGGIRSNRQLKPEIEAIQKILDEPGISRPGETTEQAIEAFLDRRAPLLVTSLDLLPYISTQATFRWTAVPLPRISGGFTDIEGGMHLLVLKDSKPVWDFLKFLYSPEIAARWAVAGGGLSLMAGWDRSSAWRLAVKTLPPYEALLPKLRGSRSRTTDQDVVRSRTDWIQALHFLFSEKTRRPPLETVLNQLDSHLTAR